jgi:hypothetical protein
MLRPHTPKMARHTHVSQRLLIELGLGLLILAAALITAWFLALPRAVPVAAPVGVALDVDDRYPLPNLALPRAMPATAPLDVDDRYPLPNLALPRAMPATAPLDVDDRYPLPNLALPD